MEYEVEYKLINIKDINKLKRIEEEDSFDDGPRIECETDIADEYCKEVLKKALSLISEDTESKYIGCTERIGHYEFEIKCTSVFYKVVFQQDTYEKNIHIAVKIGYKDTELCNLHITGYDFFLERLKLSIKKVMIQDWEKCIWISDSQSLQLSKEVYSDIYIAENEFRAFVSKLMIENFGIEWYRRPEFYKIIGGIDNNADRVKRNVPSLADIDVNIYTVTLESLMHALKADIYTDTMPDNEDVQKAIKMKIFATTQLEHMKSALEYLKNMYTKKYKVWEHVFLPYIEDAKKFEKSLNNFIENRNHVAHNKLLDYSARTKMLQDTEVFRQYIKDAGNKFEKDIISAEVEETLQVIEDQREYEREAQLEIIESEAGVAIRDKAEILELFREVVNDIYNSIYELLYFNENLEVDDVSDIEKDLDFQLIFTVADRGNAILSVYANADIDDSEGGNSILEICVYTNDDIELAKEYIVYTNGAAVYNSEQSSYMPITEDELDDGNKVVIKEVVENYIKRLTEEYETMGYSEEARAQEDWEADAADMMEETSD